MQSPPLSELSVCLLFVFTYDPISSHMIGHKAAMRIKTRDSGVTERVKAEQPKRKPVWRSLPVTLPPCSAVFVSLLCNEERLSVGLLMTSADPVVYFKDQVCDRPSLQSKSSPRSNTYHFTWT